MMISTNDFQEEDLTEELARKEKLQEKHYKLFNELQSMASELPTQYQQRLPYELLSSLASCLLDDTVPQIVNGLKEIQHITERNLFEKRQKAVEGYKAMRVNRQKKNKEAISNGIITSDDAKISDAELDKYIEDEIRKLDMKSILDLDQVVSEQQVTLERVGVPGFHVTNNASQIQLQMYLLDFISRIGNNNESE